MKQNGCENSLQIQCVWAIGLWGLAVMGFWGYRVIRKTVEPMVFRKINAKIHDFTRAHARVILLLYTFAQCSIEEHNFGTMHFRCSWGQFVMHVGES